MSVTSSVLPSELLHRGGGPKLSPRARQTLSLLLEGAGEKQVAAKLGLSPHTVHVYVKELYRKHRVCSRAELLVQVLRHQATHAECPSSVDD